MKKDNTSVIVVICSIIVGALLAVIHFLSIDHHKNKQDRWLPKKRKAHKERRIYRRYIKVPRRDIYEGY